MKKYDIGTIAANLKWRAAGGYWHLEQPRLTALLIYSGVHGVADEAIANQLHDSTDFSQQIALQYLKMLHHDG